MGVTRVQMLWGCYLTFFTPDEDIVDDLAKGCDQPIIYYFIHNNLLCFIENPDLWVIYVVSKQNKTLP